MPPPPLPSPEASVGGLGSDHCFFFPAAGYVALFTLPKVYEQNKEKIDEVFGQVKEKVAEISAK